MNIIKRITVAIFVIVLIMYSAFRIIQSVTGNDNPPVITIDSSSIEVSVKDSEKSLLSGVTAEDDLDGDISSSIIIESISNFINDKRIITYVVSDSSNNITRASRELSYSDYISPRIEIAIPLSFTTDVSYGDIYKNVKAYDVIDGDISEDIKIDFVNYGNEGSYPIDISVTNSAGDTVHINSQVYLYDNHNEFLHSVPRISLKEYVIYANVGDDINAQSYLDSIAIGSGEGAEEYNWMYYSERIKIDNSVDSTKPGVYFISYSITIGGYTGKTDLIVVVEEG